MNTLQNAEGLELALTQDFRLLQKKFFRIEKGRESFKYFCYIYFPQYFYADPSLMHEDFFIEIQEAVTNGETDNLAYAAPRGNAKSTIISFALPIWVAVYKLKHYILITSDTTGQANDFLANVRSEFEDNELLVNDFGDLMGEVWTNSDLILRGEEVRIQALGVGKKIRGRRFKQWRPDLIICDDLENDENVRSADQRKNMETWHNKALAKAGDERTDKIVIGTIIHYDSLLNKLLKNPLYKTRKYQAIIQWSHSPLWQEWEKMITDLTNPNRMQDARQFYLSHEEEMLKGTQVLWPQKEPYYVLMLQFVADGPAAFSSEKQNEPLSDDDRLFLPEWIEYYDDADIAGVDLIVMGWVDPSMGKQGGDYSGIVTVGMDPNGIVYVLDADLAKRHPDIIALDVIAKHRIFHYQSFGVEINQFQEYFKDTLQKKLEEVMLDIVLKGVRQHTDKILRIQSLQPDVKNGRIKFKRDQTKLIEQLINFPFADNDDGPDALQGAVSLLGKRSAVADFYKEHANDIGKQTANSFLQNPTLQGIAQQLQQINKE
jgi:predicted phage terminase large subunit-like protein